MRWNQPVARRTAPSGRACILVLLLAAWTGSARAQVQVPVHETNLGRIGLRDLALIYPSMVYRPIDSFAGRPGGDALGMGGAFLASASGTAALGWNPAGMADLNRTSWTFDGYQLSTSATTGDHPREFVVPGNPIFSITKYEVSPGGGFRPNFLAVAAPIWSSGPRRLVGGFGWRYYADVGMPEQMICELGQGGGQTTVPMVISMDRSERGGVEAFSPSLAFRLSESFSVGGTVNVLTGSVRANTDMRLAVLGAPDQGSLNLRSRYSGLSPEFGGRGKLGSRITFGVRYAPGYALKVRGGTLYSRSLAVPVIGRFITRATVADYNLEIPSSVGAGVAFRLMPRLLLAADMNAQSWSETSVEYRRYRDGSVELAPPDSVGLPLEDVTTLHFGAEYRLIRARWGDVPIRVGVRTAPLGFLNIDRRDVRMDTLMTNPVVLQPTNTGIYHGEQPTGNAYSLGASLETPGIRYDVGFETSTREIYRWFFESPYDAILNAGSALVVSKQRISKLRLSVTYMF